METNTEVGTFRRHTHKDGTLEKRKHRIWNSCERNTEVGTLRRHPHIEVGTHTQTEHLGNTNIEFETLGREIQKSEHLGDTHKDGTLGKHNHRIWNSWKRNTDVGTLRRHT